MILALALALVSSPAAIRSVPQSPKRSPVRERFAELFAKRDHAECVALWRQNPGAALPTIDRDLEGALKIEETKTDPDRAEIAMMRERAVWGARCAAEALGDPLVADYAASFAGWNGAQQKFFREEQALYRKAMGEIEKGESRPGLVTAQEVVQRAVLLGDWWGAAMGHEASAIAHQGLSSLEDALAAWSQARLLYRDLGLIDNELECLKAMTDMCSAVERPLRGRETAEQAALLAGKKGDKAAQAEMLTRRAAFEEKLGDREAAEKTRKEAAGLKG